jgi:subfamily B ATP-binding cassette protein MsbA
MDTSMERPPKNQFRASQLAADVPFSTSFRSVNWPSLLIWLKPYRVLMGLAILASLLSSGFSLLFPLILGRMIQTLSPHHGFSSLNSIAGMLIFMFLLISTFYFLQSFLMAYIGERVVFDLRTSLYDHLQALSMDFHSVRYVGDLVSRLSNDVTQMRSLLTSNVSMALNVLLTVGGSTFIVLALDKRFSFFILALATALSLSAFFFGRLIERESMSAQDLVANATVVAEEGLQAIRIVKSFGREPHETERYTKAMTRTLRSLVRLDLHSSGFAAATMFLGLGFLEGIIWFGGREVISGRLSQAMIIGCLFYAFNVVNGLSTLGTLYGQLKTSVGGVHRVLEILGIPPSVQDAPNAISLFSHRDRITFRNVSFTYDGRVAAVNNLSFQIENGETLALVGPSGAGKSTVFNLIARFYDPTSGTIEIGGRDFRLISQHSLRAGIAIVPQETILFGGTVRDNILYGQLDASNEEMVRASQAADAHDFIMALPDRYETIVGQRGTNLSGGQRQRIAIARAFLKNPSILLLDEATNALDIESEAIIQQALNRLMRNRTTITIAHRLSSIRMSRRIIVMNQGCIIAIGTHDELLIRNQLYARLYSQESPSPGEHPEGSSVKSTGRSEPSKSA